jgi:hypothetical protein
MGSLFQDRPADWTVRRNITLTDLTPGVRFSSQQGDSHGNFVEDLWILNLWIEDFLCYNYSNLESVTIIGCYNWWISYKLICHSKFASKALWHMILLHDVTVVRTSNLTRHSSLWGRDWLVNISQMKYVFRILIYTISGFKSWSLLVIISILLLLLLLLLLS